MIEIDESDIESIIKDNSHLLIEFGASWCGPCKMQKPILEKIEKENSQFIFGFVNIDENDKLTKDYNIISVPTIMVIIDGLVKFHEIGLKNEKQIKTILENKYDLQT